MGSPWPGVDPGLSLCILVMDPGHPKPHLSNAQLAMAVFPPCLTHRLTSLAWPSLPLKGSTCPGIWVWPRCRNGIPKKTIGYLKRFYILTLPCVSPALSTR